MATMNSSVLACSYVISGGADASRKMAGVPATSAASAPKLPTIRAAAQEARPAVENRRAALFGLAAAAITAAAFNSSPANAGVIDDYLEKSKANKVAIFYSSPERIPVESRI